MAYILGININEMRAPELMEKLDSFLKDASQHYIVTPNPEILLEANKDEELFFILGQADIDLADGFGLKLAGLLSGHNLPRITGADLTKKLLYKAEKENIKTTILNWDKGLSKASDIESSLEKNFSSLEFQVIDISRSSQLNDGVIEEINSFRPQMLFVALGSPFQEKVIYHNLPKISSVKIALGVGGSFDFISGRIKRAPKIFRFLGLEWLWRLAIQPRRYKRIYNATCVFMGKFLRWNLINSWQYRPNVACLIYKTTEQGRFILTVKREDNNQWQIPQGGRDGEDIEKAARREIEEELGLKDGIITKGIFRNVYKYDFDPNLSGSSYPSGNGKKYRYRGYKGQRQALFIGQYKGPDESVELNFWDHTEWKWVKEDKVLDVVDPIRRKGTEAFLKKFDSLF